MDITVRRTGPGHDAVVEVATIDSEPSIDNSAFLAYTSVENGASLVATIEIGLITLRRDHAMYDLAHEIIHELRERQMIDEVFV